MTQLRQVSEPFGEVNVHPGKVGRIVVRATMLLQPHKEGAKTGIALDGSGSMSGAYGHSGSGGTVFGSFFGRAQAPPTNQITPIARKICAYLARKMDADGSTACIYWATGPGGASIEEVADFTAAQAEQHFFAAPAQFGTGSQLLPAVRHFTERFQDAPFGFFVFITDGEMHDLEEVKTYSRQLAQEIAARRRLPLKFVLVGVGENVNEEQMAELDDLDTATDVDLWDYKIAAQMHFLEEIFAEVVDRNLRVAPEGRVLDHEGKTIKDYSTTGVPAVLEFEMSDTAPYFTLEMPGHPRAHQAVQEGVLLPTTSGEQTPDTMLPASPVAVKNLPPQEEIDRQFLGALARALSQQSSSLHKPR